MLHDWIDSLRKINQPVPPSLAIGKAKRLAKELNISEDKFKASWKWFSHFRERRGMTQMFLHGEVDKNDPTLLNNLQVLYSEISKYEPRHVYNMDETGLFYRMVPKYTLIMPDENVTSVRGKKKSKDRVSLVVCANATGDHKIPLCMIGKPKEPACSKNRKWPLVYLNQNRAWMDVAICWQWFENVFLPAVTKKNCTSSTPP